MAQNALFAGLVFDEKGDVVKTAVIGDEAQYVVDDDGFYRHINSEEVDRQVVALFLQQLEDNKEIATQQMMNMMGKDDLFTKAAIDASLRQVNIEQILQQGIPEEARNMLGMMGFRIVINIHGEIINIEQPGIASDEE